MKKMSRPNYWLLFATAGGCGLIMFSCAPQPVPPGTHPKVTIEAEQILIHPRGPKLSQDDEKAMDGVLQRYNKSLYKIRTYEDGKLVRTRGRLNDLKIDKGLASEVAEAIQNGFSDTVIQISGLTCHTDHLSPTPQGPVASPPPQSSDHLGRLSPGFTTHTDHPACDPDLHRIGEILEKYSAR
jgi:hypothetical protein